jgi:hypothetical protein
LRLSFAIFAVKSFRAFNRKVRKGFAKGAKKTAGNSNCTTTRKGLA